jgi:hypothetical protein
MRESYCKGAAGKILVFPTQSEQPKSETPVCWSDQPELVLERLRQITGCWHWWRP